MNVKIDGEMLQRFVLYEKYVEKQLVQAARRHWFEINLEMEDQYEKLKEHKKRISSLVDLAFLYFGEQNGIMKTNGKNKIAGLEEDFEILALQLRYDKNCRFSQ